MTSCDLASRDCAPCRGEGERIEDPAPLMTRLHPDWQTDGLALWRRFAFKGFAKPVQLANLAAWLGDKTGHHPDVGFGWGWCEIRFTSHELGGLSQNDFTLAARLDALVA